MNPLALILGTAPNGCGPDTATVPDRADDAVHIHRRTTTHAEKWQGKQMCRGGLLWVIDCLAMTFAGERCRSLVSDSDPGAVMTI